MLQAASGDVDLPRLFVAIGYLSLFGLAFFLLMELLERLTIPWHVSRRDYMATPANEATL